MDENINLLLDKASRTRDWEHEEHSTYDYEALRQEFRKRLYASPGNGGGDGPQGQQADKED